MLEAILPISDREPVRRNLDRAVMALESYNYFWRGERPLALHIVVPDQELGRIQGFLTPVSKRCPRLNVDITPESVMSPVFADFEGRGYQKQMLIKLGAFNLISTPFVVTFDTDVVACRPFRPEDIIIDGKAANDWVVPTTTLWYLRALDILGVKLSLDKLRFFVTPQVLSTVVLKELAGFLTQRFSGQDWMYGLMRADTTEGIWSEYALYDLFAELSDLLETYHLPPGENRLQRIHAGIWYASDFEHWEPEKTLADKNSGYFMVLQSITANDLNFDDVKIRWLQALTAIYPDYLLR